MEILYPTSLRTFWTGMTGFWIKNIPQKQKAVFLEGEKKIEQKSPNRPLLKMEKCND
jgi:hypothetical protein